MRVARHDPAIEIDLFESEARERAYRRLVTHTFQHSARDEGGGPGKSHPTVRGVAEAVMSVLRPAPRVVSLPPRMTVMTCITVSTFRQLVGCIDGANARGQKVIPGLAALRASNSPPTYSLSSRAEVCNSGTSSGVKDELNEARPGCRCGGVNFGNVGFGQAEDRA